MGPRKFRATRFRQLFLDGNGPHVCLCRRCTDSRVSAGTGAGLVAQQRDAGARTVSRKPAGADDVADGCRRRRLAPDAESEFRRDQWNTQTVWNRHGEFDLDRFAATRDAVSHRRGRLAMDAVCFSRAAGRIAGDPTGTLRSGIDRRIESMANVSTRDAAVIEAGDSDRSASTHDGSAARLRSDFYSDGRWTRLCDRDDKSLHLSHRVSLL